MDIFGTVRHDIQFNINSVRMRYPFFHNIQGLNATSQQYSKHTLKK